MSKALTCVPKHVHRLNWAKTPWTLLPLRGGSFFNTISNLANLRFPQILETVGCAKKKENHKKPDSFCQGVQLRLRRFTAVMPGRRCAIACISFKANEIIPKDSALANSFRHTPLFYRQYFCLFLPANWRFVCFQIFSIFLYPLFT